jgi:hypothetical protein
MVGLHSSDPATVVLAARARLARPTVALMERALYDEPSVLRMHGMRRTMFVEPLDVAVVVQAAATRSIAVAERRRVETMIAAASITDDPRRWLAGVESATLSALRERREASAVQLGHEVPELRIQIPIAVGKRYESTVGVSTRVLFMLAIEGHIVRGRPLGTWISSQYRWRPVEAVLPDGFPDLPVGPARVEIVRRWLAAYGPGTLRDIRWWSGFTAAEVKRALAELNAVAVDLDGADGWVLPDDLGTTKAAAGAGGARFLPSLDPTVMGWADRGFFLGPHATRLFDRNGNAGPTVWWEGRVVGGWAQRPDGEIAWRILEDVGSVAGTAIEAEAARLGDWIGDARVIPRFRTPLEKTLSA